MLILLSTYRVLNSTEEPTFSNDQAWWATHVQWKRGTWITGLYHHHPTGRISDCPMNLSFMFPACLEDYFYRIPLKTSGKQNHASSPSTQHILGLIIILAAACSLSHCKWVQLFWFSKLTPTYTSWGCDLSCSCWDVNMCELDSHE